MIGALSIVRFRHPVKSALELIIYFDLITIGIATSVRTKWSVQLTICTILIIVIVKLLNDFLKSKNKSFYNLSFNEGVSLNSISIKTNKKIDFLEKNENLVNFVYEKETTEYIYNLSYENKKDLQELQDRLGKIEGITKINTDLV